MADKGKEAIVEMEEPKVIDLEIPLLDEKPRKRKKKEKEQDHLQLEQNLYVMVKTVFELIAQRDPIWRLSDVEIEAVTKPGARILVRLGAEEETNKNADYIMLIIGIAGIIIPRLMMVKARGKVAENVEQRRNESKDAGGNESTNRASAAGSAGNVKFLLPSLA